MSASHTPALFVRISALAVAIALAPASPQATAQTMDHSMMQMPMNMPMPAKKSAPVKKPVHKTAAAKRKPAAAMDHPDMDHDMADMPGMQAMDHSTMPGMSIAPTEPITPIPELTDADRAAAEPAAGGHAMHDNGTHSYALLNRLEGWNAGRGTGLAWEGKAWIGTDLDRLWLRSEGERVDRQLENASLEVLYGHGVSPWWDVVTGIRHDFKPGASQDFAAIGVMGLAPYKFEVAATAYIGQSGQTAARIEVEYETLLTNRLILQPLVEINLYGKNEPRRGIDSGLSTAEAGLRLRYEFTRRFAPYIGIVQERSFGNTADLRRADGKESQDTRFVMGVRGWF